LKRYLRAIIPDKRRSIGAILLKGREKKCSKNLKTIHWQIGVLVKRGRSKRRGLKTTKEETSHGSKNPEISAGGSNWDQTIGRGMGHSHTPYFLGCKSGIVFTVKFYRKKVKRKGRRSGS